MGWQGIIIGSLLWAERSPLVRLFEKAWSEWLILGLAILAGLFAVAAFIIAKIRAEPAKKEQQASQWLAKYSDLHSKGGLSDEEFRTIKTKLSEQLRNELNDNGDKG
jgi:5-bromo-4-chloroindolyl phosphate hydrolysis protein